MTSTAGKLSVVVFSNYPALALSLLPELCITHTVLRVVSFSPDIAEFCKTRGLPFTFFPKCPEGAMVARICKEDSGYRLMVDDVYSTVRDCRPEVRSWYMMLQWLTGQWATTADPNFAAITAARRIAVPRPTLHAGMETSATCAWRQRPLRRAGSVWTHASLPVRESSLTYS